ncbi:hypothetical protein [Vibrio agarivorans]|uniref:Uncharacterized protein n=1 Tax=Vibrio agarivorans TaxID=153622 RepID=A0ABT7Y674_9VIBR|nr:hypothetical protein [Vibrio agarivorans]MDN2483495.1 hypothetical protein [Vibrio agarivorans]
MRNAPSGVAWAERAIVVQGIPKGTTSPDWWSKNITNKRYLSDEPWTGLVAWFTIFQEDDQVNSDHVVSVSDIEIWLLKGESVDLAEWERVDTVAVTWASNYLPDLIHWQGSARKVNSREYGAYRFSNGYPLHGGSAKIEIEGQNVHGVFATMSARLIESDNPQGSLLMSLGVDYYPDISSSVEKGDFQTANYLPGAGGSRFVRLSSKPKKLYFANISRLDKSNVELSNPFYRAGGKHYLTIDQWETNPAGFSHTDE